jgi:hypothetical protein
MPELASQAAEGRGGAGLALPGGRASERTLFVVCARLFRAAALRLLSALAFFCRSGGDESAITKNLSYAYARQNLRVLGDNATGGGRIRQAEVQAIRVVVNSREQNRFAPLDRTPEPS